MCLVPHVFLDFQTNYFPPSRLLDLIKELNSCPQIPPYLRFDLRAEDDPAPALDDPSTAQYRDDVAAAEKALQEARAELAAGEMSPHEYKELEESLNHTSSFAPTLSLTTLTKTPHTAISDAKLDQVDGGSSDLFSAFVTPGQEEDYLQDLDAFIAGNLAGPRPHPYANASRGGDKATERDRDAALRNPVSVYNWLRKHQPQVFLQDNELNPDKSANRASNARTSKRTPAQPKQEQEMDEDGILIEFTGGSRGKRKRDDDGGYRPKGGSSRPSKRKKDDGQGTKRGKKSISEAVP